MAAEACVVDRLRTTRLALSGGLAVRVHDGDVGCVRRRSIGGQRERQTLDSENEEKDVDDESSGPIFGGRGDFA